MVGPATRPESSSKCSTGLKDTQSEGPGLKSTANFTKLTSKMSFLTGTYFRMSKFLWVMVAPLKLGILIDYNSPKTVICP